MRRRGDDDRVMNACFDAKLLHVACKTVTYNCVNSFALLHFKLYGSRFAGRTELADGVSNMGDLLELLLRRSVGLLPPLQHRCSVAHPRRCGGRDRHGICRRPPHRLHH
jgi:hypothetical protein